MKALRTCLWLRAGHMVMQEEATIHNAELILHELAMMNAAVLHIMQHLFGQRTLQLL